VRDLAAGSRVLAVRYRWPGEAVRPVCIDTRLMSLRVGVAPGIIYSVVAFRVFRAVTVAAAGAVVTLVQLNLPSKLFWVNLVALQWGCVIVVALYASCDAVQSANQAVRYRHIAAYNKDARDHECRGSRHREEVLGSVG
jgi:hypothetical protein